jgi:hypothetical protein
MDDPVNVDLDPEEALRLLLGVERRKDEEDEDESDEEHDDDSK